MSSRANGIVLALAFLVVLGSVALGVAWFVSGAQDEPLVSSVPPGVPTWTAESVAAAERATSAAQRVASAKEAVPADPAAPTGTLRGVVLDHAAGLLPYRRVELTSVQLPFHERVYASQSNEDGQYRIADVPAGTYHVHLGEADDGGTSRYLGTVTIAAEATTQHQVRLRGPRAVSGVVDLVHEDGGHELHVTAFLQLRALPGNELVGTGEVHGNDSQGGGSSFFSFLGDAPGAFEFSGLLPGNYVLRIAIGPEEGAPYAEHHLNLTTGDATVPPVTGSVVDFIGAAQTTER